MCLEFRLSDYAPRPRGGVDYYRYPQLLRECERVCSAMVDLAQVKRVHSQITVVLGNLHGSGAVADLSYPRLICLNACLNSSGPPDELTDHDGGTNFNCRRPSHPTGGSSGFTGQCRNIARSGILSVFENRPGQPQLYGKSSFRFSWGL